jgi:hypothetical protein
LIYRRNYINIGHRYFKIGEYRHTLLKIAKIDFSSFDQGNISWNEFMNDCKTAINTPELHSDEYLSNDKDLAQEERDHRQRPERIHHTNSVIKVYNKKW